MGGWRLVAFVHKSHRQSKVIRTKREKDQTKAQTDRVEMPQAQSQYEQQQRSKLAIVWVEPLQFK